MARIGVTNVDVLKSEHAAVLGLTKVSTADPAKPRILGEFAGTG
jgi:hypothetical protein